jgi:multidrug efflux pump subunit AcrA (membrane-fusion protein)
VQALRALTAAQQRAGDALTSWADALATQARSLAAQIASAVQAALAQARQSSSGQATQAARSAGAATVSESRLITDRANVTSAESALAKAQDDLAGATLTAPLDGVIGSIPWAVGDSASSGSGIRIIGGGASQVTVQVPQANLASVRVGQVAHVSVAGVSPVDGRVSAIALLPTASNTGSSPTYAVDILVAALPDTIGSGGRATVSIVVQRVDGVLAVPASAVTAVSVGVGSVGVVKDGASSRVTVQTGAVGSGSVEVLSGLALGDLVVLGDPSQALPTNGGFPGVGGGLGGNVRVPGAGGGAPPGR